MEYDYVIVGAGPSGLTLAWYLASYGKTVAIVEREQSLGGCHRVRRVDGLFTEHGPRLIVSNYLCFKNLLREMGLNFDKMYVKDNTLGPYIMGMFKVFSLAEFISFASKFVQFLISPKSLLSQTMGEFTAENNFSIEATDYVDLLCRITDGATSKNYTAYEFYQLLNQMVFYNIYQPVVPNDIGLFKYWSDALKSTGLVKIMLGVDVESIESTNENIVLKMSSDIKITGKNYIFAIPPKPMVQILSNSPDPNLFGSFPELVDWERKCRYLDYLPVIFHWDQYIKIKPQMDFPQTAYGLIYLDQSTYTKFTNPDSKTVFVCAVSNRDVVSPNNNKTANECTPTELVAEVFAQLKAYRPYLPEPTRSILSPEVYKNSMSEYETTDSAFMLTRAGYRSNKSIKKNLFWVGTHNGNTTYAFTAMESAIQNAISLLYDLVPRSRTDITIPPIRTFRQFILLIGIIILLLVIVYFIYRNKSK